MRTPGETVREFVDAFIGAWPGGDAGPLGRFFADDAVYCNGPLDPVVGREAIVSALASMMQLGGAVNVDIVHLVEEGPFVMTERVDYWTSTDTGSERPQPATLRVAGICEVHLGRLTAWRDYFDLAEFTAQMAT